MTSLLFPDNTVLVNFALVDRMDVLERIARGRSRWCATVAKECRQSAAVAGLEALATAPGIFGDPLYPESPAEHLATAVFRTQLAAPGDARHKHLGEAETLAIMTSRADIDGAFVTDDIAATRLARKHGVTVYTTWDLLKLAVHTQMLDDDELWKHVETLRAAKRGVPRQLGHRAGMESWLRG